MSGKGEYLFPLGFGSRLLLRAAADDAAVRWRLPPLSRHPAPAVEQATDVGRLADVLEPIVDNPLEPCRPTGRGTR